MPTNAHWTPCKKDEIVTICDKFNIPCIEDAAESLEVHTKTVIQAVLVCWEL